MKKTKKKTPSCSVVDPYNVLGFLDELEVKKKPKIDNNPKMCGDMRLDEWLKQLGSIVMRWMGLRFLIIRKKAKANETNYRAYAT